MPAYHKPIINMCISTYKLENTNFQLEKFKKNIVILTAQTDLSMKINVAYIF